MSESLRFIDPVQLAKLSDLQLLARIVVEGVMTGLHRSPHSGVSIEFAQYRPYTQGDDPRTIDWRLYGRTDRLHIKQYQEETNLRGTVLLDCSASMNYGSQGITKFAYARMLAACTAMILHRQHDAVGFAAYHHEMLCSLMPRIGNAHLRRIFVELDHLEAQGKTDTGRALHYLGDALKPRGMVILISDLLHPIDEMIGHLKSLRSRRHEVIVLQISDPAERDFPFDKSTTFVDMESGREQFAVPENVREKYLANRKAHFERIRHECLVSEIAIQEFFSDEPLDRALHFFLQRRSQALMTSSLRGRRGARGRV